MEKQPDKAAKAKTQLTTSLTTITRHSHYSLPYAKPFIDIQMFALLVVVIGAANVG